MRLRLKTAFVTMCLALALLIAPRAHAQIGFYCYEVWDFLNSNGGTVIYTHYLGASWWEITYVLQGVDGIVNCLG